MSRICIVCGARQAEQLDCKLEFCGAELLDTLPFKYVEDEDLNEETQEAIEASRNRDVTKVSSVNDLFEDFPPLEY